MEALELPSATAAASHVKDILADFADVLNEEGRLPPSTHGVEHHIVTSGRPVTAKFRRLDNVKLAAAKADFQLLEKEGIKQRLGQPSSHGPEKQRFMATMQ